jgi:hypothetical protein
VICARRWRGQCRTAVTVLWLLAAAGVCLAQETEDPPQPVPPPPSFSPWTWQFTANTFAGLNYQHRKFRDFDAFESQNWLMAAGERPLGAGRLRVGTMWSFETFTLDSLGSPQVFQTGETFGGVPLIDYQHPHDLIMQLGAAYTRSSGRLTFVGGADIVGSPTLGPPPFMHRPSASENPQAPLSHHYLDSTHTTPGVIWAGVGAGSWRVEGSWFQGLEPDENRRDLDLGSLDSGALRILWARGPWSAQVSGALLNEPERVTPYDAERVTASLSYARGDERQSLAWMAAFGQNREIHGNLEAYLLEATMRASINDVFYTRLEFVAKDILDVGFHPIGFHRHRQSQVGAFTLGYLREFARTPNDTLGIGADVTLYSVPGNLRDAYGSPVSYHLFARYRVRVGSRGTHIH